MALMAADCAGLHCGRSPQTGGGAVHAALPSATLSANSPPPTIGSSIVRPRAIPVQLEGLTVWSGSATYARRPSVTDPHSPAPSIPPLPIRVLHSTLPVAASSPWTTPDFWPTIRRRWPDGSVISIGGDPKSTSGPLAAGQLVGSAPPHARFHASPLVSWLIHLI